MRMYFGRDVAVSNRRVITDYALPKRVYLGPTSMDTEMAFIMCNQAQVFAEPTLIVTPACLTSDHL
jgi:tRNA (guanine10-N2)-methyltransferase